MIKRSSKQRMAYLFLFAMLVTLFPAGAAFAATSSFETDKAYYVGESVYANAYLTDGSVSESFTYATVYTSAYSAGAVIKLIKDSGKFGGKFGFTTGGSLITLNDAVYGNVYMIPVNSNGDTIRIAYGDEEITRTWVPELTASISPATGSSAVAVTDNIYVNFNRDVPSTVANDTYFILENLSVTPSQKVSAVVTLDNSKRIKINPTADLGYSTNYRVTVKSSVYDAVYTDNALGADVVATFKTTVSPGGTSSPTPSGGGGTPTTSAAPVSLGNAVTVNVTTNANGTKTAEAKVSLTEFTRVFDANKNAKEFVLEIKESVDNKVVTAASDIFSKLAARGASLVIKSSVANLTIPGDAVKIADVAKQLGVDADKVEIKINVKDVLKADADKAKEAVTAGMNPVSKVLEFTMEASASGKSVKIDNFGGKVVKGEFPFTTADAANVKDKAKLSVFKLNDATGKWVYVRSKAADGKVIFYTTTFSKYTIMEYSKTFADMSNHWAKADVELMASKFVVNGISSDKFAPEANVTRAQFAAMLVRALGLPAVSSNAAKFKDVKSADWFAADVAAAAQAGLILGFEDSTFQPNAQITRDQMAVMVSRALKAAGKDIAVSKTDQDSLLAKFSDGSKIQSWAKAEVAAAAKAGIINGVTSTSFVPAAKATRAQSAAMLKRMMTTGELI